MPRIADLLGEGLAGRYRLDRLLGTGGMARVFLAEDLRHGRWVAVKVLRPDLSAAIGPERFLREISIAAPLVHPHILPIHDSGEAGGSLYYVMPYVEGPSLRERLEQWGPLPVDEAVRVARDVAEALDYAHGRGIVHRDVKPGNILLAGEHAMVADFGIAVALSAAAGDRVTEPGAYLGTPEYMSPEQIFGEETLDGRSDEYSLGCVVYEALAGRPPFTGTSARAVFARHTAEIPPPVTTIRPDVPDTLDRALQRALAKAPAERFPTVLAFAEGLASRDPGPDRRGGPVVGVLAFVNLGPDPSDEYLGDGISDEIIAALGRLEGVRVVSRTSAFAFKGRSADIRAIGRQLGAGAVLEGSVRRAGGRIRVTAQLADVDDGYSLWSDRYDRDVTDVFAIQEEIAAKVAAALAVVLSDEERRALRRDRTPDPRAYDFYLRGRQFVRQFSRKGMQFARQMFARAIEEDAGYARAWAGVADCASFTFMFFHADPAVLAEADEASRKALEIAPALAEAHASRGLATALSGRYPEAAVEFEEALRLNPRLFEAHYFYARSCFQAGEHEKAARLFESANAIREDYQAAVLAAQAWEALGRADLALERYRAALAVCARYVDLNPGDARALSISGGTAARSGEPALAREWIRRAVETEPADSVVLYAAACGLFILGDVEEGLADLEAAVAAGFANRTWIERDPDLDSIRGSPRYQALLARL